MHFYRIINVQAFNLIGKNKIDVKCGEYGEKKGGYESEGD